jgi:hypothetical protein
VAEKENVIKILHPLENNPVLKILLYLFTVDFDYLYARGCRENPPQKTYTVELRCLELEGTVKMCLSYRRFEPLNFREKKIWF